jgi:hypothetical protein
LLNNYISIARRETSKYGYDVHRTVAQSFHPVYLDPGRPGMAFIYLQQRGGFVAAGGGFDKI